MRLKLDYSTDKGGVLILESAPQIRTLMLSESNNYVKRFSFPYLITVITYKIGL